MPNFHQGGEEQRWKTEEESREAEEENKMKKRPENTLQMNFCLGLFIDSYVIGRIKTQVYDFTKVYIFIYLTIFTT